MFLSWIGSSNTPHRRRTVLVSVCPEEYSHISTARLYLIGQERVHRGGQGGSSHRCPFSARVARVTAWRAPGRGIPLPPWVLRPRKRGHSPGACLTGACGRLS